MAIRPHDGANFLSDQDLTVLPKDFWYSGSLSEPARGRFSGT